MEKVRRPVEAEDDHEHCQEECIGGQFGREGGGEDIHACADLGIVPRGWRGWRGWRGRVGFYLFIPLCTKWDDKDGTCKGAMSVVIMRRDRYITVSS